MTLRAAQVWHSTFWDSVYREKECSFGFHVWNPMPEIKEKCLCGEEPFSSLRKGFVKMRQDQKPYQGGRQS